MRNPLRTVARWWLRRRLPRDLKAGDICMVVSGDSGYKVVKILVIDQSTVHVRLYAERFSEVPRFVTAAALTLGTIHDEHHGIGHLPLSRPTFASWLPLRIQHEVVTEDELDGFRMWEISMGGTWG